MPRRFLHSVIIALCALALLGGCSSKPEKEQTERELYVDAHKNLGRGNFLTAQTKLQELETRFPFGRYSEQAQLDMLYAQMRARDYPSATETAKRFLRQHPGHAHTDYVLYLSGLANYWLQIGVLERRLPFDAAVRDLGALRDAFGDFSTLVTRFPDSPFAPDARARMLYVRNLLAAQEIAVGWYYMKRNACIAAMHRAQYVIGNFPGTTAAGDALVILGECNARLGEKEVAQRFVATLKANFPEHRRLRADGTLNVPEGIEDGWSWLRAASFGLLGSNAP